MHFALLPRRSGSSTYCNGAPAFALNSKNGAFIESFTYLATIVLWLACDSSCSFVFACREIYGRFAGVATHEAKLANGKRAGLKRQRMRFENRRQVLVSPIVTSNTDEKPGCFFAVMGLAL